jgi:RND family efflux transporter MFP subunit
MASHPVVRHLVAIAQVIGRRVRGAWRRYRALRPRYQIIIAIAVIVLVGLLLMILGGGKKEPAAPALRTVTLAPLGTLAGAQASSTVLGSVRSITEAEVLAQSGGTVRSVNTVVGRQVGAGFVLAELDNSAERAAVLQAEGAYDAALASREAVSPEDARAAAENAYRDAFSSLETALENDIDTFFGGPTPAGPDLLINPPGSDPTELSRARADLDRMMDEWRSALASTENRDPDTLLGEAEVVARDAETFASRLAEAANRTNSRATAEQFAALASARASVSGVLASLSGARTAYRSGSTSSTASVDAGVKSALGNLRLAQSNLEKTVVRAPISGTVNFLPIRVGDYVTPLQHVATVAQNGALEAVAFVSEDTRAGLSIGMDVGVDGHPGIITSIAPALDPITKQIEIHVAVNGGVELVNGQAVHIGLPETAMPAQSPASQGGVRLLPLTAVKLFAGGRLIFMVSEGRLTAIPVTIGDVRGDRLEVMTDLPDDARIVVDARGLSDGQAVNVAQ